MRARSYSIVAIVALLAGCSHQNIDFKAPDGWKSSPSVLGNQMFIKPGGTTSTEIIVVMRVPMTQPTTLDGAPFSTTPITICGSHAAVLMKGKVASRTPGTKDQLMESVSTNWNGDSVSAIYTRPEGMPPDPEAEAALKTLCLPAG